MSIKHPRRFGFVVFNLAAAALFALAWSIRTEAIEAGVAGLPNLALGTAGTIVVATVWAATWIAWGWMVWLRRRRRVMGHRHGTA